MSNNPLLKVGLAGIGLIVLVIGLSMLGSCVDAEIHAHVYHDVFIGKPQQEGNAGE